MAAVDRRLYQPPNHELSWTLRQPFFPIPFSIFEPLKRKNNEAIMLDWAPNGVLQQGVHLGHLHALTEARQCVSVVSQAPSAREGHWLPVDFLPDGLTNCWVCILPRVAQANREQKVPFVFCGRVFLLICQATRTTLKDPKETKPKQSEPHFVMLALEVTWLTNCSGCARQNRWIVDGGWGLQELIEQKLVMLVCQIPCRGKQECEPFLKLE